MVLPPVNPAFYIISIPVALKLHIKNMVCIRCKMLVKEELNKLGLHYVVVELGEAEIMEDLSAEQRDQFRDA